MKKGILTDALTYLDENALGEHLEKKTSKSSEWGNGLSSQGGAANNPNPIKKKWWITIAIAAALVITGIVIAILFGSGNRTPKAEEPMAGLEPGIYYYDTTEGEYLLVISENQVFTILGPSLNKSGKYVVTENGIELDFVKDEDGIGSIKDEDNVITLQYKDRTMRFLKKITYTVNFDANGGSHVDNVEVLNGKTVAKPADPTKAGSVFIGWYADEACTQLYRFSSEIVTTDITVYAKWADLLAGQNEYTVSFDLGYESEGYSAMTTLGGKLYNVPTPEREGYTFGGWWISMTQNADKLTYAYDEELIFRENTTLFALWQTAPEGSRMEAPLVEVHTDSIEWNVIKGVSTYHLQIINAEGDILLDEKQGGTIRNFSFRDLKAGEYTILVTALGNTPENNSETTVRTYVNKALDRVSLFTVIDGSILLWNNIGGAEKYRITVDCGNDEHKHTDFENGSSTTFLFGNCPMQKGGIRFTVTAVADGKVSSVSETFVYDRSLDAIDQILYNEMTHSFYWNSVTNATKYLVTVITDNDRYIVDNDSATTFCVKNLSGKITLEVIPVTEGYNSPEATTVTYDKTTLAAPEKLEVRGTILSWSAVEYATGYVVKINNQSFQADHNSLDLNSLPIEFNNSTRYDISVMAVGAENSLYSDVVTMSYLSDITHVSYKNNTVSWTPVIGVETYEIRVNNEIVATISGANSAKVKLTKAGINLIDVRYIDMGGSAWVTTEVYAYEVIYDSRSVESGITSEFLARGDRMTLPTNFTMDGYEFTAWYNCPDAAAGMGGIFTETRFSGASTLVLYANWKPKTFHIKFEGLTGVTNIAEGATQAVTYQQNFTLPIPENPNADGEFIGWYTHPGASGTCLTDAKGNSITEYPFTRDTVAYPFFDSGVLNYIMQADKTYAVTAGPAIHGVANVTIPEFYRGVKVTAILDNAFYGITTLEVLNIPATIRIIGVGAIPNTKSMREINVYTDTIQQNYDIFYSSHAGALLRHDMGSIYLEVFPRGKTGEYTIPDHVNVIRDNVFRYSQISKLTVGTGVTFISRRAFYGCEKLTTLEFKSGGTDALSIDPEAFYKTTNLTTIRLPARLAEIDLQVLNTFAKLDVLEVESGGSHYSSVNNTICDALGNTILYVPLSVKGEYEIPMGIKNIGPKAFMNRTGLTKLIIPAYIDEIGKDGFAGCTGITEVLVKGNRISDLLIDEGAFQGCTNIKTVIFQEKTIGDPNAGVITIGISAFAGITQLKNLTFEAGVNVIIGDRAFANNDKLKNPTYTDGCIVQSIGKEAFTNCTAITEIVIPSTTTTVGDGAFSGCSNIIRVTFQPNGTEVTFGDNVFANCKKLNIVYLPATIAYFDGSVFAGCDAITEIVVDEANQNFATHEKALYTKDYSEILFYPKTLNGDLSKLHTNLKKIGNNVFENNSNITSVTFGNNMVSIGDYAFHNCSNLTNVTFEDGISSMSIGVYAFAKCQKLKTISLPDCTTVIGDSAFRNSGLSEFQIPESTISIGQHAFNGAQFSTITIPANVTFIGNGAFANCTKLKNVIFEDGNTPLSLGTLENTEKSSGVFYNTIIEEFNVGDRVTLIGAYAFYAQFDLVKVTMGEGSQLTDIGPHAFHLALFLNSVTLGSNLKTIHTSAFEDASDLSSITIPKSVTLIDKYAFSGCDLSTLFFEMDGTLPLTIGEQAFADSTFKKVTLPARLQSTYYFYTDSGAVSFKVFDIFDGNSSLKTVTVEEGGAYFASIDGILYEVNADGIADTLLFCPPNKSGTLTIPKEVRKVENGAFSNTKLSQIIFAEYSPDHENYGKQLLEIGNGISDGTSSTDERFAVFYSTKKITIQFPSHLKSLGVCSFYELSDTGSVVIFNLDAHLQYITGAAMNYCAVQELILPAVDEIHGSAFYGCGELTKVVFHPNSNITDLSDNMFFMCTSLTSVEIPASVTRIGKYAFGNCYALTNVIFLEGCQLKVIDQFAFLRTNISEFIMPDTVEILSTQAFYECEQLKKITLSSNLVSLINEQAISATCPNLEAIIVPDNNANFMDVDGVLYDKSASILYAYPRAKDPANFSLPEKLISIESYAMAYFKGEYLILPESLEFIGEYAFAYSHISSIHIPRNVVTIGTCAFLCDYYMGGVSLEALTFAENSKLEAIEQSAFLNNSKLVSISLPDGVKNIGRAAFSGCASLETIILPAALESLAAYSFAYCTNLKTFIMQQCLVSIGNSALMGTSDQEMYLTELIIPSSVKSIERDAFSGQTALKTVIFADGSQLESIAAYTFKNCSALESIVLPMNLKSIDVGAFDNCKNMKLVDMSACTDMQELIGGVFSGCISIESMILPSKLTTIGDYAFGSTTPENSLCSLKQITVPASVSTIGNYAFFNCIGLETVQFAPGSQLVALGVGCFENSGMAYIQLPDMVVYIAERAFKNCSELVDISLPAGLIYLGDEAFYNCQKIQQVDLFLGLEYLGTRAFGYCTQLQKIYIPATVTDLEGNPFMGCSGVKEFILDSDNVDFQVIDGVLYDLSGSILIYYPASLPSDCFLLPESVLEIGAGAFAGATAVQEIWISGSLVNFSISADAFSGVDHNLAVYFTDMTYEELVAIIGSDDWYENASESVHFHFKEAQT